MYYSPGRSISLFLFAICIIQSASASVIMTGSRIIYPSDAKSVDAQLRNNDDLPYIIQAWFDNGDKNSTPATGKAPFIVTPPTFKIAEKQGQVLRIFYTGGNTLPLDRESLFYFNFLQVPPANTGSGNQMVVLLKNRLKVFYRPANLKSNNKKLFDYLTFSNISSTNIRITNTSPYYMSISQLEVKNSIATDKTPMIAPFTYADISLKPKKASEAGKGITVSLVNDYGAMVTHEYPIQ